MCLVDPTSHDESINLHSQKIYLFIVSVASCIYKLCSRSAVEVNYRYPPQDDRKLPLHSLLSPDYYVVQSMPKGLVLQCSTS